MIKRFNWTVRTYSPMSNHYHLLIETPDGNLARGMGQIKGICTQCLNRRHHRVGHVLPGRYKADITQKDGYPQELVRYIASVLNPSNTMHRSIATGAMLSDRHIGVKVIR